MQPPFRNFNPISSSVPSSASSRGPAAATEPVAVPGESPALIARRATAAAPASATSGVVRVDTSPFRSNGNWSSLDHIPAGPTLVAGRIHAVALGEVLAN